MARFSLHRQNWLREKYKISDLTHFRMYDPPFFPSWSSRAAADKSTALQTRKQDGAVQTQLPSCRSINKTPLLGISQSTVITLYRTPLRFLSIEGSPRHSHSCCFPFHSRLRATVSPSGGSDYKMPYQPLPPYPIPFTRVRTPAPTSVMVALVITITTWVLWSSFGAFRNRNSGVFGRIT